MCDILSAYVCIAYMVCAVKYDIKHQSNRTFDTISSRTSVFLFVELGILREIFSDANVEYTSVYYVISAGRVANFNPHLQILVQFIEDNVFKIDRVFKEINIFI